MYIESRLYNMEKLKQNRKWISLGVLGLLVITLGVSFAYWIITLSQTGVNEIASSCFSITLTNEQNAINLQKAYPILDEEGKKLTPYTFTIKNNCDTYASYTINLELLNTIAEDSRLSAAFVKAMIDEETPFILNTTPATTTLDNAYEAYTLTTGYLDANEERSYSLRLWMDESVTIEDDAMNKQLESKITITASYIDHMPTDYDKCVEEYGEDSIQCSIIADASDEETGKCPTFDENGIATVSSTESTNGYICSAPDDYGTSYYFRGTPDNNYVKFAGYYWRILRINGDGSIRMIYAGDADVIDALENKEEVLANGYNDGSTDYTQIGTSYYNYYWKKDNVQETTNSGVYYDNAALGYMYGNRDGVVEGSTQYGTFSHSNTTTRYYADSYTYNPDTDRFTLNNPVGYTGAEATSDLVGKYTMNSTSPTASNQYVNKVTSVTTGSSSASIGYSYVTYGTTSKEKAQENINDSTIKEAVDNWYKENILGTEYEQYISDTLFCNDRSVEDYGVSNYSNLAYGPERTSYRAYYSNGNKATLYCKQQNDRFTVNDENIGNGDLTYPVGLLTSDEATLAGGRSGNTNYNYYLYTGNYYWTMSPSYFSGDYDAGVRYVYNNGYVYSNFVSSSFGVRPVLNLKSGSLKSGQGTASDPYLV